VGRILRLTLIGCGVLAVFALLEACGRASSPAERQERNVGVEEPKKKEQAEAPPANLPSYDVTLEQDCSLDYPAKCYAVTTTATSTEDLEALTRHFAEESPEHLAVTVSFYPPRQTVDISGTGFYFANEEVARSVISQMYQNPGEANVDEQVNEAMQNDGIYVIAITEAAEEMNREVCAEWDVTTMGTPPPEMDCPGY
jgi:hypothetical protein